MVPRIVDISEADAHVANHRAGESDGNADSQNGMGNPERIEVAVAQEDEAGDQPPDHGQHGENRVG